MSCKQERKCDLIEMINLS